MHALLKGPVRGPFLFPAVVAVATLLAAFLRAYGVKHQVVIDDEWHAIHKLMSSSYAEILDSFGLADHSIPLTLLYKAMADTVGLAEGRLRFPQIACGIALVPLVSWLAWRALRDAPAAALTGFLVAGAPFLVMWSRFARPYAITLLLSTLCAAAIWRWRSERWGRFAAVAVVTAALSAWFHPVSALFVVAACLFVFCEDVLAAAELRPRPSWQSLKLGSAVALAMAWPLASPLYSDAESLSAKAGGDRPDWAAMERFFAIVWGGVPAPIVAAACAFAAWGVVVVYRHDRRLAAYLLALGLFPGVVLWLAGALWMQQGQNFLRYQLPVEPIVLFFGSVGAVNVARAGFRRGAETAAWVGVAIVTVAYLAATPAIAQVVSLGPWYGNPEYHWDYRHRWMRHKLGDAATARPPAFYAKLAAMKAGSAPIIETPFIWEGFLTPYAFYARFHEQPARFGMLYDVCLTGMRLGEPPMRDPRFRFRKFVALDDREAVLRSGSRYLLLHRRPPRQVGSEYDDSRCLPRLRQLYGEPIESDERLAVFDLRPGDGPPASR
jgi:hypothetical protein